MVIALDGYSSSGKSTLSVMLAEKLGFNFLNTGMIFRSIAYYLDNNNVKSLDDENAIKQLVENLEIDVEYENNEQIIYLNKQKITQFLYTNELSLLTSYFSKNAIVREKVVSIQHAVAKKFDVVVEGRDIGTVVFPTADYKFFITADVDVRANRRFLDVLKKDENAKFEDVKNALIKRDDEDTNRQVSPLKCADDAIIIDTSNKTTNQALTEITSHIK